MCPDSAQAQREARSAEHCQGCQHSWPLGVALSLVTASKAALPLCEARQAQDAVICTGGMLKSTAGVSYRNLRWETGAEHQGQLPKHVCGGNPEEEKLQPQ